MSEDAEVLCGGAFLLATIFRLVWLVRKDRRSASLPAAFVAAWGATCRRSKLRLRDGAREDRGPWITADGREVRLVVERTEAGANSTLEVGVGREGSSGLTVERQSSPREVAARLLRHELEIGDPAFYRDFSVRGNAAWALAVLDKKTRRDLAALLRGAVVDGEGNTLPVEASFQEGVLKVRCRHRADTPIPELSRQLGDVLYAILRLARRLVVPRDPATRIAANLEVGAEEEAGVRRASLRLLLSQYPQHAVMAEVIRRGLEDQDPVLKIEAQIAAGQVTEESLLSWTDHEDAPLAKTAVQALGKLGTAAAVPKLRALEERGPRDLTRAARQAIAEIQSRLVGAEHGQLSLSAGEAGALTLATEDEPGRLSLAAQAEQSHG